MNEHISSYRKVQDGQLHWTLSFYIPLATIRGIDPGDEDIAPLGAPFDLHTVLKTLDQQQTADTRQVREAIDPLFNDIADRTRQNRVLDRLLVPGPREETCFYLPDRIDWKTEGKRFRVTLTDEERVRPAEMRRFWYLHSDGAMSWHVAFAISYHEALERDRERGRLSTLYFLSLLQKLAWPKECDATDAPTAQTDTAEACLSPDALLKVKIGPPPGQADQGGAQGADGGTEPRWFWKQIEHWFEADRAIFDQVHSDAGNLGFATLLPPADSVEIPHLKICDTRSLFFFSDSRFFDLIQPKTREGMLVPRRARVLEDPFKAYPKAIDDMAPENGVRVLDATLRELTLGRDVGLGVRPAQSSALPDAWDRMLYLFLAGFNQNIIDWVNQEASEVLDSLDPIYPASDEQLQEGFFIRYANPRSLVTYVKRSRTLEVGNDHILTCPYAFLIHVLTINNEFLTRAKEERASRVIGWVSAKLREAEGAGAYSVTLSAVEHQINRLRIDSFEHFDQHRYVNPFRYDTERTVFDDLEKLRGTSRLESAYREALAALEDHAKDLERIQVQNRRDEEQKQDGRRQARERALANLFGIIGLAGLGQLLFNIEEYAGRVGKADHRWGDADRLMIGVQGGIILLMIAGLAVWGGPVAKGWWRLLSAGLGKGRAALARWWAPPTRLD